MLRREYLSAIFIHVYLVCALATDCYRNEAVRDYTEWFIGRISTGFIDLFVL